MDNTSPVRNLRFFRAYYFFFIGAGGFLSPFVTLFYKSRGLNGAEIGLLGALAAFSAMLTAPIWGRLGDTSSRPRRLIKAALLASACFALLRGIQSFFWSICLFIILDALFGSGTTSLSSLQALAAVNGEKSGFGSVRLWGSLGWAVVTPLAGFLIERLGLYIPFAGYAAMLVLAACALAFVRGNPTSGRSGAQPGHVPVRRVLRSLAGNRAMVGMALAFVTIWISTAGRVQFETLYMSQLGAKTGLIGIAGTVSALFEVPFMLLADRLIHRYGTGRILRISIIVQAVSFLPVVLFHSIPGIFLTRILASIALSLNAPSYYNYLVECAPPGQGTTVVSFFDVTLRNGVGLVAAPLAGLLFDLLGPYWLYAIGMGGCLLAWSFLQILAHPQQAETV